MEVLTEESYRWISLDLTQLFPHDCLLQFVLGYGRENVCIPPKVLAPHLDLGRSKGLPALLNPKGEEREALMLSKVTVVVLQSPLDMVNK